MSSETTRRLFIWQLFRRCARRILAQTGRRGDPLRRSTGNTVSAVSIVVSRDASKSARGIHAT